MTGRGLESPSTIPVIGVCGRLVIPESGPDCNLFAQPISRRHELVPDTSERISVSTDWSHDRQCTGYYNDNRGYKEQLLNDSVRAEDFASKSLLRFVAVVATRFAINLVADKQGVGTGTSVY